MTTAELFAWGIPGGARPAADGGRRPPDDQRGDARASRRGDSRSAVAAHGRSSRRDDSPSPRRIRSSSTDSRAAPRRARVRTRRTTSRIDILALDRSAPAHDSVVRSRLYSRTSRHASPRLERRASDSLRRHRRRRHERAGRAVPAARRADHGLRRESRFGGRSRSASASSSSRTIPRTSTARARSSSRRRCRRTIRSWCERASSAFP